MNDMATAMDVTDIPSMAPSLGAAIKNNGQKLSLSSLFRSGSIIVLDISVWSGTTKLNSADLGVPDTPEVRESLNFGTERLVPRDLLAPLVNRRTMAHNLINDYSAKFDFLPGSKFVPKSLADGLEGALKLLQGEFNNHVSTVVVPKYEEEAAKQLKKTEEALLKATEGKLNQRNIVDVALARIRTKLPAEKELAQKFKFAWARRSVNLPKDKAIDAAEAAELEAEVVKNSVADIVKDYASRVMELANNIKEMIGKGSKPTAATLKSIRTLRDKVAKLDMFGGQSLAGILNNLESLIETNIELGKVDAAQATTQLTSGITAVSLELDAATQIAIEEAIAAMNVGPEITI